MTMFTPGWLHRDFDRVEDMARNRARTDALLSRSADEIMEWDAGLYRQWITDDEFRSIRVPVLIAGMDANINNAGPTIEMARILHRKIPTSDLTVLPRARAMVLLEDPAMFTDAARPFFDRVARQE
jgi:pimeloyl-ACP methyl ester carboxylesterase